MINGKSDLVDATSQTQGIGPSVFSGLGGPDLLTEYIWALASATPGRHLGFATPGQSFVPVQIQQTLQLPFQQAQQHLQLLHQQIQQQLAQNPYSAQWLLNSFYQQVQQVLQVTQVQTQQQIRTLLQSNASGQLQGPPQVVGQQLTDEQLEHFLSQALESNPVTADADIEVVAKNHEVTLRGTVPNRQIKRTVDIVAWSLPGVKNVNNDIAIQSRRTSRGTSGRVTRETVKSG